MRRRSTVLVSSLATVIAVASGCATSADEEVMEGIGEVNARGVSKWAVDMKKVKAQYGTTSKYFFGQAAEETALAPAYQAAGQKAVWDQTFKRDMNHELVQEDGSDVAVILEDGTKVDPPGYVNIVPLLKNTEPSKQVHLRKVMKDGDVLVYFHPEDTSQDDQMERRASHVAMHYDHKASNGQEYVHHLDNPDSYGPQYNHAPNRRMPFHVFRFLPRKDKVFRSASGQGQGTVTADGVTFTTGQAQALLGYLTNTANTVAKIRKDTKLHPEAARNIVNARTQGTLRTLEDLAKLPQVGRRSLERLRDTVAGPAQGGSDLKIDEARAALYGKSARNYGFMNNGTSPFADFFTLNLKKKEDLASFVGPSIQGTDIPEVYCSGLAYANLNLAVNHPKNEKGLGTLWQTFERGKYRFSDTSEELTKAQLADDPSLRGIDRLVFEPYGATDILNNWIEVYMDKLPLPLRQQLLQSPQLQQSIMAGLYQLAWSGDAAKPSAPPPNGGPANADNVKRWAKAYGLDASATTAFLAADPDLKAKFDSLGLPIAGLTPMDVLQAVEEKVVKNRFVPPRIWMDEADREDSDMVYVATVLNCELLSAKDGSGADACAGGDQGAAEFKEGAADTSTYPHYAVANGREISHRRFIVTSGPEKLGKGTRINVRATHADMGDVRFLLHTSEAWKGHALESLSTMDLDRKCAELSSQGKVCAPDVGILLDPAKLGITGAVTDASLDFDLDKVCTIVNADELRCPTMKRGSDGKWVDGGVQTVSRQARGVINVTMADLGGSSVSQSLDRCTQCSSGGGHFNGWTVRIRND